MKTSIHVNLKVLVTIFVHFLVKNRIFFQITQGCGNTMPDLSDMVPFHSGQVENFFLLVLGQVQMYLANTMLYFIFWLIITSSHLENSVDPDQLVSSKAS